MAEDLGKRLLAEVEEVGLDEIFHTIRLRDEGTKHCFDLPPLDRLVQTVTEAKPASIKARAAQPVIELTSTAPGGGKTHLLYHLTALAVLPSNIGGKEACVIILDTDGAFSVSRVVEQLHLHTTKSDPISENITADYDEVIKGALKHVHIFRPQSLASAIATLGSLPTYLFDRSKHYSIDRPVSFIALGSASAFYWETKAKEENNALLSVTGIKPPSPQPASGYAQLTAALKATASSFCCPIIFTSWYLAPTTTPSPGPLSHTLRPSLPAPLSQLPSLRLLVQRVPVRKFPAGISVESAHREAADRLKAVDEGKFECAVNEWGVDERTLQKLQRDGAGFGFRMEDPGLLMDESGAKT